MSQGQNFSMAPGGGGDPMGHVMRPEQLSQASDVLNSQLMLDSRNQQTALGQVSSGMRGLEGAGPAGFGHPFDSNVRPVTMGGMSYPPQFSTGSTSPPFHPPRQNQWN